MSDDLLYKWNPWLTNDWLDKCQSDVNCIAEKDLSISATAYDTFITIHVTRTLKNKYIFKFVAMLA